VVVALHTVINSSEKVLIHGIKFNISFSHMCWESKQKIVHNSLSTRFEDYSARLEALSMQFAANGTKSAVLFALKESCVCCTLAAASFIFKAGAANAPYDNVLSRWEHAAIV
jgi:hypothetical protein